MKSIRLLALLGCTALAAPSFAQTFTDNWWFTDLNTGQTVGGTVSGLSNGDNLSAEGLTIMVTQSPYADLLGAYTNDIGGVEVGSYYDSYSASDGVVTFANFLFSNDAGTRMYFGTNPQGDTFYPQLVDQFGNENAYNFFNGTSFSAAAPSVPEPASWALMVGGFGLAGMALRSRRQSAVSFG